MCSVHYRIFKQNDSICNNHCPRCLGETTQAGYDCISIKTWGCFISVCILTVVMSSLLKSIVLFFWQVHQRNGSKSCIDGAREKKYNLISSIQFYTNQRRRYHTSHSSKHTLLTVSVHAYNYCVYPKQKQLPPSKCTFLEWNKKKNDSLQMLPTIGMYSLFFCVSKAKHSFYPPHWTIYHLTFKA